MKSRDALSTPGRARPASRPARVVALPSLRAGLDECCGRVAASHYRRRWENPPLGVGFTFLAPCEATSMPRTSRRDDSGAVVCEGSFVMVVCRPLSRVG